MTRYPLEPLAQALGLSLLATGKRLGVSGTKQKEYRQRGISWRVADHLAGKAGYHPAEIWPEWTDDAIAAITRHCEHCGDEFPATHPKRRFCNERCRKRAERRRWQLTTDAGQEANRRHRRNYYTANADYERAERRRRYRARTATTEHQGA